MERSVFETMAANERRHWWFIGRRAILTTLIQRVARPAAGGRVLDAGCGSGGNLEMLSAFGDLDAVELDDEARRMAEAQGLAEVRAGSLPDAFPVDDGAYSLIGLFDVLEHIEDDLESLRTLGRKLAPGGRIVLSVPAQPWLWSQHDVAHHHYRRFTRATLRQAIQDSGLEEVRIGYFNTFLFPVALFQRLTLRLTGLGRSAEKTPPSAINSLLSGVFSAERHFIDRIPLPIGLSLFAVVAARNEE